MKAVLSYLVSSSVAWTTQNVISNETKQKHQHAVCKPSQDVQEPPTSSERRASIKIHSNVMHASCCRKQGGCYVAVSEIKTLHPRGKLPKMEET